MHAIYLFLIVAVFFMVYCEGVRLLNSVFSCTEIYMHPDVGDLSLLVRSFRSNLFFQNSNKSFPYLIKKKKKNTKGILCYLETQGRRKEKLLELSYPPITQHYNIVLDILDYFRSIYN